MFSRSFRIRNHSSNGRFFEWIFRKGIKLKISEVPVYQYDVETLTIYTVFHEMDQKNFIISKKSRNKYQVIRCKWVHTWMLEYKHSCVLFHFTVPIFDTDVWFSSHSTKRTGILKFLHISYIEIIGNMFSC